MTPVVVEGHAYLLGNWPAPYGIPLVLDRLAAGMDDHLPKPFRQVELQAVLMRQLEADEPQRLIA